VRDAVVIDVLNQAVTRQPRWGFWKCYDRMRIPAKPGRHSDASEAIIPVDGGPVVRRENRAQVAFTRTVVGRAAHRSGPHGATR
jgi:hypothetical protein